MKFNDPIVETIRERFSCRTYLELPIKKKAREQLERIAHSSNEGPFGHHLRFEVIAAEEKDAETLRGLGTYGFIKNPTGFIIGATKETENHLEDFGCVMEKIILKATEMGLGTCWLGGTFNRSRFAKRMSLRQDEIIPAVVSIGYIAEKPARIDRITRETAKGDRRFPWKKLFFENRYGFNLTKETAGKYAIPLEMVRLGPSASNRQPWRIIKKEHVWHFYLKRNKKYPPPVFDVLLGLADLQRVDMGIAMCHFALTAEELGLKGSWEMKEPTIELPDDLIEYVVSWVEN